MSILELPEECRALVFEPVDLLTMRLVNSTFCATFHLNAYHYHTWAKYISTTLDVVSIRAFVKLTLSHELRRAVMPNISLSLRHTSCKGHVEVVRLLLAVPGIAAEDVRSGNNFALRFASNNGHMEVVRLLLAVPGILAEDAHSGCG